MFERSDVYLELSTRPRASWESKCQVGGVIRLVSYAYQFTDDSWSSIMFLSFLDSLERVTAARYMPSDGEFRLSELGQNSDIFFPSRWYPPSAIKNVRCIFLSQLKLVQFHNYLSGVSEHRFKISTSKSRWVHSYQKEIFTLVPGGAIREWKIFDVGGHRSQVEVLPFIADSPKLTLGYR